MPENNGRVSWRVYLDQKFTGLEKFLDEKFTTVDDKVDDHEDRIRSLEKRIT